MAAGELGTKPRQSIVMGIRCTKEWKGWLEHTARRARIGPCNLIDLLLAAYAAEHGLEEPPVRLESVIQRR
jgi:hypothetical protein